MPQRTQRTATPRMRDYTLCPRACGVERTSVRCVIRCVERTSVRCAGWNSRIDTPKRGAKKVRGLENPRYTLCHVSDKTCRADFSPLGSLDNANGTSRVETRATRDSLCRADFSPLRGLEFARWRRELSFSFLYTMVNKRRQLWKKHSRR